ncbi:CD2 antigen cytoplasmic tail-binding protein 2, partial [Stegodyphus mimosarum]
MSERNKPQIYNHEELEAEIRRVRETEEFNEAANFKKSKHSLDSDEEDDEEELSKKYNVMDPSELEGQEEGTIDYDGEIKITPFNMREELEEGFFDKEGTYIFNKEADVIKDQWLDDIDWIKVKATEGSKRKLDDDADDSDEEPPQINLVEHYTEMLKLMQPKETVQKAICRLGGKSSSSRNASSRWKKKKDAVSLLADNETDEDYEKLQRLTSLADDIIHSGDMDIYQQTYEKLSFYVDSKRNSEKTDPSSTGDTEEALDMFGEDFDEKVDPSKTPVQPSENSPPHEAVDPNSEVMWEFKWDTSDDAKIYGPYPTSQMLHWTQEKYFDDGVLVRQVGKQDSEFYSSKRIDFELYL